MDDKILTKLITEAYTQHTMSKGVLRIGQCIWNTFDDYFKTECPEKNDKFQQLRGSNIDPFYVDSKIDAFLEEVAKI